MNVMCCSPLQHQCKTFNLGESPSWVGAHMQLVLHKPQISILQIVSTFLQDKALEEGEEYDYIPIEPLDTRGTGKNSTPKIGKPLLLLMACQVI